MQVAAWQGHLSPIDRLEYKLALERAEAGDANAQYAVANALTDQWRRGHFDWHPDYDLSKGVEFYLRASAQGYADASRAIGEMYKQGQMTGHPDPDSAEFWYELANRQSARKEDE